MHGIASHAGGFGQRDDGRAWVIVESAKYQRINAVDEMSRVGQFANRLGNDQRRS